MRLIKMFISLSVFVATSSEGISQEKSLLWRVSGNGLSHPSYIYGTVHLICADDYVMKNKVVSAFQQTEKLVVEVDLSDPKEMQAGAQLMNTGRKISDSLSEAEEKILDSILQKQFRINLSQVDSVHPAVLESMMARSVVKCKDRKTYDLEFIKEANQQGKPVDQFETMLQQVDYLKKVFSAKDVVRHGQLLAENEKLFSEMIIQYKNEDIEGLARIAQDRRFMTDAAQYWLLDSRNNNWVKKNASYDENGICVLCRRRHTFGW